MTSKKKIFRFFSIDWEKLRTANQSKWVVLDLFMLVLVFINLLYIAFDWSFGFLWVQNIWQNAWPSFYEWYAGSVHPLFYAIDLLFVAVFILELLFRWGVSIYNKSYGRWFYYPFIHWYDVLSCIPLYSAFRVFRLLRLFSLFYRLQRVGAIDITSTYLFGEFAKYTNIIVEEISDRVVINVLSGAQQEVKRGIPVSEKIIQDVLLPRKEVLVDWLSQRISDAVSFSYTRHREELKEYVDDVVNRAVKQNKEIRTLELIPGLGKTISTTLDRAISDITFNVVDNMMNDLSNTENKRGIKELSNAMFGAILEEQDETKERNELITGIVTEAIEVVKQGVMVKQWKEKEMEEKEKDIKSRFKKAFKTMPEVKKKETAH